MKKFMWASAAAAGTYLYNNINVNETVVIYPENADKEINEIMKRPNDNYYPERERSIKLILEAKNTGKRVLKRLYRAAPFFPNNWYYEILD